MKDAETRSVVRDLGEAVELSFRRAALVVVAGPDLGREFELAERAATLGRGEAADLRLNDGAVSRVHARLEPEDAGWRIVDLESKSGVQANGVRVRDASLATGARFRLGETELELRAERARWVIERAEEFHGLRSGAPEMRALFGMLRRVAALELPVLLLGEPGTGKEALARAVHEESPRAGEPYEVVDCTLLTGDHLRSELFGHTRGAFTGAASDRDGAFVRADGGTLVLDEVGELPLDIQPMLLRALQQGEVRPLGAADAKVVRVRVVAATNRDLAAMVEAGTFRADLYHRLNALEFRVPPLRERRGDRLLLAEVFLPEGRALSREARMVIEEYPWPGNVRELANALRRAAALAEGREIGPADLGLDPELLAEAIRCGTVTANASPAGAAAAARQDEERIREALRRHGGNRKAAARELGISRTTLYKRLREMGLHGDS